MTVPYWIAKPLLTAAILLLPLSGLAETPSAEPESQDKPGLWDGVKGLQEKFRPSGEQAPPGVAERLREDARRIGTWEYRVVSFSSTQNNELEKELNELGLERWEAFLVQPVEDGLRVFLKRSASTYLQAVPMAEYLRLIPKAEQGDETPSQ
jgi:hypothetical protein